MADDELVEEATGWNVNGDRFTATTFLVTVAGVVGGALGALLLPWAVVHGRLGGASLVAVVVFLAFAGMGYVYAWRRGDPEWHSTDVSSEEGSTPR